MESERLRVMTISQAVDLWLAELSSKRHSERTLETYRRFLDKLADAYPQIDVEELSPTQVRRFLEANSRIERGRKRAGERKSAATVAQNVSIVNGFFDWLTRETVIRSNPVRRNGDRILSRPRLTPAYENDNVTTVSSGDVRKLKEAADRSESWPWKLAVNTLIYAGARRHAVAVARLEDYDPSEQTLTFREKGGKTIAKPLPWKLARLIDSAIAAGVYESPQDYLIPGKASQRRPGDRDDRVIWRLVNEVAEKAGVVTHVHALRAAFAVEFLERNPGEVVGLQNLMGHKRIETTLVYLRRLDRRQAMESVRDMDWGDDTDGERFELSDRVSPDQPLSRRLLSATQAPVQNKHFPSKSMESTSDRCLVDLQPSFDANSLLPKAGTERGEVAPGADPFPDKEKVSSGG